MPRSWFAFYQVIRLRLKQCLNYSIGLRNLLLSGLVLLLIMVLVHNDAKAEVQQIDNFGSGTRWIPDITSGGLETISGDEIIDIVILGDGYLAGENTDFFNDAQTWYDTIFGTGAADPHLIIIKDGSYPGPLTLDDRTTLLADGGSLVGIGD